MNAAELDEVYSALCHRLTAVGEQHAPLYLCRLALLLANEVGDTTAIHRALDAAQPSPAPSDASVGR